MAEHEQGGHLLRAWRHLERPVRILVYVLIALSVVMRSPRFESFRTVDVLLLLFGGAALGAGLANLFAIFRAPRDPSLR